MANDFILSKTAIQTMQIKDKGTTEIVTAGGFMITDILITSTSTEQISLIATDDINTHIIIVIDGKGKFNHAFAGGWVFWDKARLELIKESNRGEVNVAVGFVRTTNAPNYNQWLRRGE